jgi:Ser/Thr protein kinase RdoA (MazF antagonist)
MTALDLTAAAHLVLQRYPAPLARGPLQPLGNHGGFSGAFLWRIDNALCLRASAPVAQDAAQLAEIHRLMHAARNESLPFVPTVFATPEGATVVEHAGRLWELMEWMAGRASYHESPSRIKIQSACTALGRLHRSWERFTEAQPALIPAVWRRLREANFRMPEGASLEALGSAADSLQWASRVLPQRLQQLPGTLLPYWSRKYARLQPCLCDVWHDNLLFEGDRLIGLVDYAATRHDHVAVDLARMLGSLVEDDNDGWREGLVAYSRQRPLSEEDEVLARVLDRTGTVVGAANWVRRLSDPAFPHENRPAAVRRLETLLRRMERWK